MGVLKAKVDGAWVEVGGAGVGVPAGGSAGQILTKTSAADYATAWQTHTPPILANNTHLQGYRADGTTAQSLIGMNTNDDIVLGQGLPTSTVSKYHIRIPFNTWLAATRGDGSSQQIAGMADPGGNTLYLGSSGAGALHIGYGAQGDIHIGNGLAAGKNIYVPRLTVQGVLTLATNDYVTASDGLQILFPSGSGGPLHVALNRDVYFNQSSGNAVFIRNVEVAGSLTKGFAAYTHPDFVFEHHFTGGIERFRDAPGADTYEGLWPLARVEEFAQEHWRLPGHAARENDRVDIFRRTHDLLAELERVYLHLFDHEKRLAALEGR